MPLEVQAKLLRVLEDGSFEPLGSSRTCRVDVRVVAATNRDLGVEVERGRFREDLFHRLNVFPIRIPPLRDRRDEIRGLAEELAGEISRGTGRTFEGFEEGSLAKLEAHDWPGNVRELRNVLTRAIVLSEGGPLRVDPAGEAKPTARNPGGHTERLSDVIRDHLVAVLDGAGWRIRGKGGAAEILGLAPTTLESRMKRLGIERPGRG
jgi:transcriptional regulator with GAF, ATPase, and Fis domain